MRRSICIGTVGCALLSAIKIEATDCSDRATGGELNKDVLPPIKNKYE
jgi:hypothetical protein